ncbi:MAG: efflux RND transporter periplasmic adaptor subunit, partial [Novosphingobium sp.]
MMLERIKRWRWAILVSLLLVVGLAWSFWPAAEAVDTAQVTRGPMAVGVTDDGVTRTTDVYIVSAPVTGYLSRIEL